DVEIEDPLHGALQVIGRRIKEDRRAGHEQERDRGGRPPLVAVHSSSTKRAARDVSTTNSMSKSTSRPIAWSYEPGSPKADCPACAPAMTMGIHRGRMSSGSRSSRARTRATIAANSTP